MKNSPTVAITIRSFDSSGSAIENLKENFTISFINKTGARLSEMDLINALGNVQGVISGTETFSRSVIDQCSSFNRVAHLIMEKAIMVSTILSSTGKIFHTIPRILNLQMIINLQKDGILRTIV